MISFFGFNLLIDCFSVIVFMNVEYTTVDTTVLS